jgi:hypothetical protein
MAVEDCEDKHTIDNLQRQLAAADAVIMGARHAIAAEYDEKQTLADKLDTLVTELIVLNAQNTHMKKLLALPIIFYDIGPVTDKMRKHWCEATGGNREMTTKVMCDAIRRALE